MGSLCLRPPQLEAKPRLDLLLSGWQCLHLVPGGSGQHLCWGSRWREGSGAAAVVGLEGGSFPSCGFLTPAHPTGEFPTFCLKYLSLSLLSSPSPSFLSSLLVPQVFLCHLREVSPTHVRPAAWGICRFISLDLSCQVGGAGSGAGRGWMPDS